MVKNESGLGQNCRKKSALGLMGQKGQIWASFNYTVNQT